jgi:thiamine biosynthesis protein ThiS
MKSTIELNHRKYPYSEGMTISSLMAENNFGLGYFVVKINKKIIEEHAWAGASVSEGDKVEIYHIFSGG